MYEDFAGTLAETMWADYDAIPSSDRDVPEITDLTTTVVDGNFPWLLVTVETDADVTGIGEAYPSPGVREIVTDFLRPVLVGQPVTDVGRLYRLMRGILSGRGSQAGIGTIAISGIEIALWDATGKHYGLPVYQLLGGKIRDDVRVYADCHAGEAMASAAESAATEQYEPEQFAAAGRAAAADGFDLLKFDLDVTPGRARNTPSGRLDRSQIDHKRAVVEALDAELPSDVELAVDLHWNFTVESAERLARAIETDRLAWIEDPIPPENVAAMQKLARAIDTPLLTGENRYGRHGFRELIESQAVAYLAPDVPKTGGIAETKAIAEHAETYYQSVVPHNIGSPVATYAAAHVAAAVPNFVALEFHAREVDWWADLVASPTDPIVDGRLPVPDGPGLGIEVDWDVVSAHEKTD